MTIVTTIITTTLEISVIPLTITTKTTNKIITMRVIVKRRITITTLLPYLQDQERASSHGSIVPPSSGTGTKRTGSPQA